MPVEIDFVSSKLHNYMHGNIVTTMHENKLTFDSNRNIKRQVYCQYGQYSLTFRALALRQKETGPTSPTKGQCSKRQTILSVLAVHRPLFIFRFVSLLCLRSTLRLFNFRFIKYMKNMNYRQLRLGMFKVRLGMGRKAAACWALGKPLTRPHRQVSIMITQYLM